MAATPLQLSPQNLVAAIIRKEFPDKTMQVCNAVAWDILDSLRKMNELSDMCSIADDVPLASTETANK